MTRRKDFKNELKIRLIMRILISQCMFNFANTLRKRDKSPLWERLQ